MKTFSLAALILTMSLLTGCSGAFWGGSAAGAGTAGAAYEIRAKQQLDQINKEYESGKMDQHEYEIRKDQIKRGSLIY